MRLLCKLIANRHCINNIKCNWSHSHCQFRWKSVFRLRFIFGNRCFQIFSKWKLEPSGWLNVKKKNKRIWLPVCRWREFFGTFFYCRSIWKFRQYKKNLELIRSRSYSRIFNSTANEMISSKSMIHREKCKCIQKTNNHIEWHILLEFQKDWRLFLPLYLSLSQLITLLIVKM